MPAPHHVQVATLERFVDAWKRWSAEDMIAEFADDFTQATLPFGMGIPERQKSAVQQVLPVLVGTVSDYKLIIHETIHEATKNKAVIYAISTGKTPFGPWDMEYAMFLTFTEAGDRIARLEEMLDSAFMQQFVPKFQSYLEEHGKTDVEQI